MTRMALLVVAAAAGCGLLPGLGMPMGAAGPLVFAAHYDASGKLVLAVKDGDYPAGASLNADRPVRSAARLPGGSTVIFGFVGPDPNNTKPRVGGTELSGTGSMFVASIDTAGKVTWVKQLGTAVDGGTNSQCLLVVDAGGAIWIAGTVALGGGDSAPPFSYGGTPVPLPAGPVGPGGLGFLLKLDSGGGLVASKVLDGSKLGQPQDLALGPSGTFALVGSDTAPRTGAQRLVVSKLDGNGDAVWSTDLTAVGQPRVVVDGSGRVLMAANYRGYVNVPYCNLCPNTLQGGGVLLAAWGADGSFQSAMNLTAAGSESGLKLLSDGSIVLGGGFGDNTGEGGAWLARYDGHGAMVWTKRLDLTHNGTMAVTPAFAVDPSDAILFAAAGIGSATIDGTVLTTHQGFPPCYTAKWDGAGKLQFATFDDDGNPDAVAGDGAGGVLVFGHGQNVKFGGQQLN